MGRRYANILETVGNTPVVRINRLAPPHVSLWVKIEAFNPLGSVKDRLALGVIEAAVLMASPLLRALPDQTSLRGLARGLFIARKLRKPHGVG